ncbi:hypothetical protein ACTQ1M_14175 [Thermoguttaceae bacterium LCP21S3_D1]
MRYNENDGQEINGKIVISTEIDEYPIFEISCVVVGNLTVSTVKANYDLVIIGNVEADKIEVAGDFTCLGDCNCQTIAVQGACSVEGSLSIAEGFVGDALTVKELCADTIEIRGTVTCINMECNDEVICTGNVLIAEGLSGMGSLSSKMTVCGEYSLLDNTSGVFIADTLEMEKPTISSPQLERPSIDIEEWKLKAKRQSPAVFYSELAKLAEQHVEYKKECSAFQKLRVVEDVVKLPSIKTYVEIIDILNRNYKIIGNSKLFQKVKNRFESFTYEDINHSKMTKISQKDFAQMLHIITFKPKMFDDSIRELILETLCMYVGMDLEVFQDGHQDTVVAEKIEQDKKDQPTLEITVGDTVLVVRGVWSDTVGEIISINELKETITMNVTLFGRNTPVEISFSEIKKI